MPNKQIIRAVLKSVSLIPRYPALRILDLSCGDGALIEALDKSGCQVEGSHFRSDDYIFKLPSATLQKVKIHEGVDLTKPLPFADEEYDVVLATEVLEHLTSHALICSEVGRILKPDGHFMLSTPNIHRLRSRLQFMLTGQHELRSARLCWDTLPADLYSTHHNPVYFPSLHTILYQYGMRVERLQFTKCKPLTVLLVPLYPLICIATAIEVRHAIKRSQLGGIDLFRWLIDYRMLFSDNLFVSARKSKMDRDCEDG